AGVATDGRCSHRTSSVSRRVRVYAAGCTHRGVRQAEWTPNTDRATRTRRVPVTGALRGVVALDGPSGTGKTTVARKLATQLGTRYLDTGSTYRTLTLAVLRAGVAPSDAAAVGDVLASVDIDVGTDPEQPTALLDSVDVGTEIRGAEVTAAVSAVAAIESVRDALVARQRAIVARLVADVGGVVVEGRDIGTVVTPDAGLKVFLTAAADVRAARRNLQHVAAGAYGDVTDAMAAVNRRDAADFCRTASQMRAAEDAVHLGTSELSIQQVLIALSELASQRGLLDDTAAGATQ